MGAHARACVVDLPSLLESAYETMSARCCHVASQCLTPSYGTIGGNRRGPENRENNFVSYCKRKQEKKEIPSVGARCYTDPLLVLGGHGVRRGDTQTWVRKQTAGSAEKRATKPAPMEKGAGD